MHICGYICTYVHIFAQMLDFDRYCFWIPVNIRHMERDRVYIYMYKYTYISRIDNGALIDVAQLLSNRARLKWRSWYCRLETNCLVGTAGSGLIHTWHIPYPARWCKQTNGWQVSQNMLITARHITFLFESTVSHY